MTVLRSVILVLTLSALVSGTQEGFCRYRKFGRPGTVKLRVVAGVHELDGGQCGDISRTNFPLLLALDWLTGLLNGSRSSSGESFIPGHTIGYDVLDNCENVDLLTDMLFDVDSVADSSQYLECSPVSQSNQHYIGTVSLTDVESTLQLSRLVGPDHLILRPLSSSSAFSTAQTNLLQTTSAPEIETQALVETLKAFGWNFVALIYTDDLEGTAAKRAFMTAASSDICVNFVYRFDNVRNSSIVSIRSSADQIIRDLERDLTDTLSNSLGVVYLGNARVARMLLEQAVERFQQFEDVAFIHWVFPSGLGRDRPIRDTFLQINSGEPFAVSIAHPSYDFSDFREYMRAVVAGEVGTPFQALVSEYKSKVLRCADCTETIGALEFDHLPALVDAVFAMAGEVRLICKSPCTEKDLATVAAELKAALSRSRLLYSEMDDHFLPTALTGSNKVIEFSSRGYSKQNMFEITTLSGAVEFSTVAMFDGQGVDLGENIHPPTSVCQSPTDCADCLDRFQVRFSYLPGDILMLGLFSLRLHGDTPYTCGGFREGTNDIIAVSAFFQSIESVREETGIKFGGLAIDDCYSPFNISFLLSELFSKHRTLTDKYTGDIIDMDRVVIIIGALASSVTIVVADQATALGLPMISYSASTPELDNRGRYPYFMRTVPSDTLQVKGMVSLIKRLNITHIGAIFIDDTYGQYGINELQRDAASNGICVEDPLPVTQESSDEELKDIIRRIYNSLSKVVVYFSIDNIALRLLEILHESYRDREPLVFIGSEAWGTNLNLIEGQNGKMSKGSLVFNIDTKTHLTDQFFHYLKDFNSSHPLTNRWTRRFWEDYSMCDFIDSFDKRYSRICDESTVMKLSTETVEKLNSDQRIVHVMQAVFAAGKGFQKVHNTASQCAGLGDVACASIMRQTPGVLAGYIRNIDLRSKDQKLFKPFSTEGTGNIGFTIFNIQRRTDDATKFDYVQVGRYSNSSGLTFEAPPKFYNKFGIEEPAISNTADIDCANFRSCDDVCRINVPTTSSGSVTTMAPPQSQGTQDNSLVTTILLAVIVGVLALALSVIIVVVVVRRQAPPSSEKESIYSESAHTSAPSIVSRSTGDIYDLPGPVGSDGHVNEGFSMQGTRHKKYNSRGMRQGRSHESLDSHVQYSDIAGTRSVPELRSRAVSYPSKPSDFSTFSLPRSKETQRKMLKPVHRPHQSEPARFEFPSESHYTRPRGYDLNYISDSEVEHNNVFVEEPPYGGGMGGNLNYITPSPTGREGGEEGGTITYLTAGDLEMVLDEEEEEEPRTPASYVDMAALSHEDGNHSRQTSSPTVVDTPSSDEEEATKKVTLNFSEKGDVIFKPTATAKVHQKVVKADVNTRSSMSSVPDVIRDGPYGIGEEEEQIFII